MNDELAARHAAEIAAHLGAPGRMVGLSKSAYRDAHPQHLVVFNANVCFGGGKVWWGDIDLTIDEHSLEELAAQTRETVYLLFELDGRFRNEAARRRMSPPICPRIPGVLWSSIATPAALRGNAADSFVKTAGLLQPTQP